MKKPGKIIVRKLSDMKDRFKNPDIRGNPTIYRVYIKNLGTFEAGLTIIEPGTINREYYMTKGHRHKKSLKEVYILLSGNGKLLIQNKKSKVINLKKLIPCIIPSKSGHRLINTGNQKLKVLTIYPKNAGHDYNFKFKKK